MERSNFVFTRIDTYLFSIFIIAPGIPVYSISTRYNLYVGEVCGKKMAYFWGVIFPWILGFTFTGSSLFADLVNWSGLIFTGVINFIVPLVLYYKAYAQRKKILFAMTSPGEGSIQVPDDDELFDTQFLDMNDWTFPKFMRGSTKTWVIVLIGTITALTLVQIFLSLYYLLFLHKNILS